MSIKYTLAKSTFRGNNSPEYIARTLASNRISPEELYSQMSFGSTITVADIRAVMETLQHMVIENLANGNSVDTGFIQFKAYVKGGFETLNSSYQRGKNQIAVRARLSSKIKTEVESRARVEQVEKTAKNPIIDKFVNHSREEDHRIMSGDLCSIRGKRLQIPSKDGKMGVFIVHETDGREIRIDEITTDHRNRLIFSIPRGLKPGNYTLIVRSRNRSKIVYEERYSEKLSA
jgi:hypothetical protein